jgi:hypothetical protein
MFPRHELLPASWFGRHCAETIGCEKQTSNCEQTSVQWRKVQFMRVCFCLWFIFRDNDKQGTLSEPQASRDESSGAWPSSGFPRLKRFETVAYRAPVQQMRGQTVYRCPSSEDMERRWWEWRDDAARACRWRTDLVKKRIKYKKTVHRRECKSKRKSWTCGADTCFHLACS